MKNQKSSKDKKKSRTHNFTSDLALEIHSRSDH